MKKIIGIFILFLSFLCCSASVSAALIWNQVDANCDSKKGFVQKQIDGIFNVCYNPQTKVEYSYDMYSFSINGSRCGNGCDFNGRNCEVGACNVADCATTYGYTELQNGKTIHNNTKCYNPTTKLAYDWENKFYKDSKYCGKNCDFDGKNCESGNCASLPITNSKKDVATVQKNFNIDIDMTIDTIEQTLIEFFNSGIIPLIFILPFVLLGWTSYLKEKFLANMYLKLFLDGICLFFVLVLFVNIFLYGEDWHKSIFLIFYYFVWTIVLFTIQLISWLNHIKKGKHRR